MMTSSRSGSVLAIALWVVAMLAAAAVALAAYLSTEIRLVRYHVAKAQARMLARAGLTLALERLQRDMFLKADPTQPEPYDWLGDDWVKDWTVRWSPEQSVTVRIVDEERHLNLNRLDEPGVAAMVKQLAGNPAVVDLVIAYKTSKGAPIARLAEITSLESVKAFSDRQAVTRLLDHATIAATTLVNINTAPREMLEAVGLPTLASSLLAFREQGHYLTSLEPLVTTEDLTQPAPFDTANTEFKNAKQHVTVASNAFTIRVEGTIAQPAVTHDIEVLVTRALSGTGVTVNTLAWKE